MNDQLIIYASRWKSVVVAVFYTIVILMFIPLIWPLEIFPTKAIWILEGYIVILCGPMLKFVILNLLRREPVLIIDAQGIYDNSSFIGVGHIKWEEISKLYTGRRFFSHYLFIFPKDYDSILSRQPFMKKIFIKMLTFMIHGFEIPLQLFDCHFDNIEQFVQKFFEISR